MHVSLRLASIKYCPRNFYDKVTFTRQCNLELLEGALLRHLYALMEREYGAGERLMIFRNGSPLGGNEPYQSAKGLEDLLNTPLAELGVVSGDVLDVYQCQRHEPRVGR